MEQLPQLRFQKGDRVKRRSQLHTTLCICHGADDFLFLYLDQRHSIYTLVGRHAINSDTNN